MISRMFGIADNWRLLRSGAADGAANMALDRALLDEMEAALAAGEEPRPLLRLYAWEPAAISTGRHQKLERACDLEACREAGVDVVQRPTGGRGVLHENEVTYSVIAPALGPFEGTGVTAALSVIAGALVSGLRGIGVPVDAARGAPPTSPKERKGACFSSTSRQEVVVDGRKLCGSAQFRGRRAFLQHGSLPVVFDVERQARLLGASAEILAAKALGLSDCLNELPEALVVEEAIERGFVTELGVSFEHESPTESETSRRDELAAALRADPARWARATESRCSA
jgi:lipoate-protein ligase A